MERLPEETTPPIKKLKMKKECTITRPPENSPPDDDSAKFIIPMELDKPLYINYSHEDRPHNEYADYARPSGSSEEMSETNITSEMQRGAYKKQYNRYEKQQTFFKYVLEEKDGYNEDNLPPNWVKINHNSGMPVYVQKGTRVCTLSKPYISEKKNLKTHNIPLGAIPCLAYKRALKKEKERQKLIDREQSFRRAIDKLNVSPHLESQTHSGTNEKNHIELNMRKYTSKQNELKNKIDDIAESVVTDYDVFNFNVDSEVKELTSKNYYVPIAQNQTMKLTSDQPGSLYVPTPITGAGPKEKNDLFMEPLTVEIGDNDHWKNYVGGDTTLNNNNNNNNSSGRNDSSLIRKMLSRPETSVTPIPQTSSNDTWDSDQFVTPEQLNEYCKTLFKFKLVPYQRLTCGSQQKFDKMQDNLRRIQRSTATDVDDEDELSKDELKWCNFLKLFDEFVQYSQRGPTFYDINPLANGKIYEATLFINNTECGVGKGVGKRQAKYLAARNALSKFLPNFQEFMNEPTPLNRLAITHNSILLYTEASFELSPYAVLLICIMEDYIATDYHMTMEFVALSHGRQELTMQVGWTSATVIHKNQLTAKQQAAQIILQALHPTITTWGELLCHYFTTQNPDEGNGPNYAVLENLRREMGRLNQRDNASAAVASTSSSQPWNENARFTDTGSRSKDDKD